MKKNIGRIIALLVALTLVIGASACTFNVNLTYDKDTLSSLASIAQNNQGAAPAPATTQPAVAVDNTTAPAAPTTAAPTTPAADGPTAPAGTTAPDASTPADTTAPASSSSLPSTPAEILAKYTEVMNQMKLTDKPGFNKVEYQVLPEDYRQLGSIGNIVLDLAGNYMTSEEKAKAEPQHEDKGSSMSRIPIYSDTTACTLTDVSAIKEAKCVDNGDGTNTITIVLNDEANPEPIHDGETVASSKIGGIFTPLSRADIDKEIANISVVKVNSFDLNYTGCTATLVYEAATGHVKSLTQIMNTDITADVKAAFVPVKGSARLVNTMEVYDFVY